MAWGLFWLANHAANRRHAVRVEKPRSDAVDRDHEVFDQGLGAVEWLLAMGGRDVGGMDGADRGAADDVELEVLAAVQDRNTDARLRRHEHDANLYEAHRVHSDR